MRAPPCAALVALLAASGSAPAQQVLRDTYYDYLPPMPKIVGQTAASAHLHLYGDTSAPGYVDRDPLDGIDDARGRRLLQLAERFSPIVRRNNFLASRYYLDVVGDPPLLQVDTWRDGVRVGTDTINLARASAWPAGDGAGAPGGGAAVDDAKLELLLRELDPLGVDSRAISPTPLVDKVLFFDMPGTDERTWREKFGQMPAAGSKLHAHVFLDEGAGAGDARYELVIQYWFYYPFNDSANNHEGDWEHINVFVTAADRWGRPDRKAPGAGLLTERELARILESGDAAVVDSLVIWKVDYYIHHIVVPLPYLAADTAQRSDFGRSRAKLVGGEMWRDRTFFSDVVRARLELAGGRLATHPITYVGGDSRGVDATLTLWPRFGGGYNRNSGANYPFPGVWREVGPLGATEAVKGGIVPKVRGAGTPLDTLPWYRLIADDRYLVYRAADIVLLPDWERLVRLLRESPDARRTWSWLVLPIHFGFPITPSPGAGALKHTDMGNIGAVGPTFTTGWNRSGPTTGFHELVPSVMRVAYATTTPLGSFENGWGVLNVAMAWYGLMPIGNVVVTNVMPFVSSGLDILGYAPTRTFFPGPERPRFTTGGVGAFQQFGGVDFAWMLPAPRDLAARGLVGREDSWSIDAGTLRRAASSGPRATLAIHYGRRVLAEDAISWGASAIEYTMLDATGARSHTVRGTLAMHDLTGGFRYNAVLRREDALQLYARAGYGWTWYEVRHVSVDGQDAGLPRDKAGYAPTLLPSRRWWPATAYGGVGVEVFSPPHRRLWGTQGFGARFEATGLLHRLDGSAPARRGHITTRRGDVSLTLLLGL